MLAMLDPTLVEPGGLRPISRKEYDRMAELGMFEDEKLELLRGMLVKKMTIGWPHSEIVIWLNRELVLRLGRDLVVRPGLPFPADDWSEPEPDIAICRPDPTRREHPSEVLLLIEVADSSLRRDRGIKLAIYAEARVPEYWIVDVNTRSVEVYTRPEGDHYTRVEILGDGDILRPTLVPGVELAVAELPR